MMQTSNVIFGHLILHFFNLKICLIVLMVPFRYNVTLFGGGYRTVSPNNTRGRGFAKLSLIIFSKFFSPIFAFEFVLKGL